MKITFSLPQSFGDLTVRQYQEAHKILNSDKDNLDKHVEVIALLSGKQVSEIEKLTPVQIKPLLTHLGFLNKPEVPTKIVKRVYSNGRFYHAIIGAEKLSAGQLITLKHLDENGGMVGNLNQMLACLYVPMNWYGGPKEYDASLHEQISNDLLDVKLKNVYGTLFFYSNVYEKLKPLLEIFLKLDQKEKKKMLKDSLKEINETIEWLKKEGSPGLSNIGVGSM